MDIIQGAGKVLADAERELRSLIEKGLRDQRYADVAHVAGVADGLAKLIQSNQLSCNEAASAVSNVAHMSSSKVSASPKSAPAAAALPNAPAKKVRTTSAATYPRFERDQDRLVKVGWSKKNREEYEHRAPHDSVIAFVRHLRKNVSDGELFDIDGLLPVYDSSGSEIPAYQLYMTLAWLRELGVLHRRGRDGYVVRAGSLDGDELNGHWAALPTRSQ